MSLYIRYTFFDECADNWEIFFYMLMGKIKVSKYNFFRECICGLKNSLFGF